MDVDVDVYVDKLEMNLGNGWLMQSIATVLVTTQDQPIDLVYRVGFKLKQRREILS